MAAASAGYVADFGEDPEQLERQRAADVEHHRAGRHDSTASLIVAHAAVHVV